MDENQNNLNDYVYKVQNNEMSNFEIPEKCRQCGYYYNFMCRAEHCDINGT